MTIKVYKCLSCGAPITRFMSVCSYCDTAYYIDEQMVPQPLDKFYGSIDCSPATVIYTITNTKVEL